MLSGALREVFGELWDKFCQRRMCKERNRQLGNFPNVGKGRFHECLGYESWKNFEMHRS